jgi:hypothetical protein
MGWVTERYEPVKLTAVKNLACPSCGKRLRRQRTFTQTISSFNSNVKPGMTSADAIIAIRAALNEQAKAWKQQAVTCDPCLDGEAVTSDG